TPGVLAWSTALRTAPGKAIRAHRAARGAGAGTRAEHAGPAGARDPRRRPPRIPDASAPRPSRPPPDGVAARAPALAATLCGAQRSLPLAGRLNRERPG